MNEMLKMKLVGMKLRQAQGAVQLQGKTMTEKTSRGERCRRTASKQTAELAVASTTAQVHQDCPSELVAQRGRKRQAHCMQQCGQVKCKAVQCKGEAGKRLASAEILVDAT